MLMQYQRDHPSDTDVQTVCPDKVPVPLYRKLRQQYENQHCRGPTRKYKKPPGVLMKCPTTACNLPKDFYFGGGRRPSLDKDKYITRNYSAPATFESTDPSFSERETNDRKQPIVQQQSKKLDEEKTSKEPRNNPGEYSGEIPEDNGIESSICDMEDVRKFLKQSGCRVSKSPERERKPRTRPPGRVSPKEAACKPSKGLLRSDGSTTELYSGDSATVYKDDQEMAAVYRDVTRTLKQDKERKTQHNVKNDSNKWKNCE